MFRRARRTYVAGRQGRQQGAPARMPTRITVRYLGSEVGKKVARPDTKGELLELAAKRLNLSTPALRVFAEGGDEYDGDEDVVLIESDEIIYVYGERRRHRGRAYDDAFFSVSLSQPNSLSLSPRCSIIKHPEVDC